MKEHLSPESAFSRAVYKLIRPAIPRAHWPPDVVEARVRLSPDGLFLQAEFSGLPAAWAAHASGLVRQARVDLVLASPLAVHASRLVGARRWRDACLYAFLPLLFAIPLTASLSAMVMRLFIVLFVVNALALPLTQGVVVRRRAQAAAASFVADIPVPGMRLRIPAAETARGE